MYSPSFTFLAEFYRYDDVDGESWQMQTCMEFFMSLNEYFHSSLSLTFLHCLSVTLRRHARLTYRYAVYGRQVYAVFLQLTTNKCVYFNASGLLNFSSVGKYAICHYCHRPIGMKVYAVHCPMHHTSILSTKLHSLKDILSQPVV